MTLATDILALQSAQTAIAFQSKSDECGGCHPQAEDAFFCSHTAEDLLLHLQIILICRHSALLLSGALPGAQSFTTKPQSSKRLGKSSPESSTESHSGLVHGSTSTHGKLQLQQHCCLLGLASKTLIWLLSRHAAISVRIIAIVAVGLLILGSSR